MKFKSLILLCIFCCLLCLFRIIYSSTFSYIFLTWNLFLAAIPLFISIYSARTSSKKLFAVSFFFWLIFFPNAPYLLTDLYYLSRENSHNIIPLWYDVILLSCFAITGLLLGFVSAQKIYEGLKVRLSKKVSLLLMATSIFMSGFGVYIGRFQRFNSWDIFTQPLYIITHFFQFFIQPFYNTNHFAFAVLFGTMLNLLFYALYETGKK